MTGSVLFRLGSVYVTVYGIFCALSLAAMVMLAHFLSKSAIPEKKLLSFFIFALPAARIVSRAVYCAFSPELYSNRPLAFLLFTEGGGVLTAALIGFVLAALAYSHVHDLSAGVLLDASAPGLLILSSALRLSETTPGETLGQIATSRLFRSAVFTATDAIGNARYAISRWEGILSLAVLAYCGWQIFDSRKWKNISMPGDIFSGCAALYCAVQIPLEALRDGAYPHIDRMPIGLVLASLSLAALLAASAHKLLKTDISKRFILFRLIPGSLALILTLRPGQFDAAPDPFARFVSWFLPAVAAYALFSLRAALRRRARAANKAIQESSTGKPLAGETAVSVKKPDAAPVSLSDDENTLAAYIARNAKAASPDDSDSAKIETPLGLDEP